MRAIELMIGLIKWCRKEGFGVEWSGSVHLISIIVLEAFVSCVYMGICMG